MGNVGNMTDGDNVGDIGVRNNCNVNGESCVLYGWEGACTVVFMISDVWDYNLYTTDIRLTVNSDFIYIIYFSLQYQQEEKELK